MRLRGHGIECHRALQMRDPRAQVSLLAEGEPQQRVSAGVLLITLQRARQEFAGGVEVALRGSGLSALDRSSAALGAAVVGFRDVAARCFKAVPSA